MNKRQSETMATANSKWFSTFGRVGNSVPSLETSYSLGQKTRKRSGIDERFQWGIAPLLLTAFFVSFLFVGTGSAKDWKKHDSNWVPVKVRKKPAPQSIVESEPIVIAVSEPIEVVETVGELYKRVDFSQPSTPQSKTTNSKIDLQLIYKVEAQEELASQPEVTSSEPPPFPLINDAEFIQKNGEDVEQCSVEQTACDITRSNSEDLILENESLCKMRGNEDHFQTEPGQRWIFWKDECSNQHPGPICCSLQEKFVNWRLSSMYLEGCLPAGYALFCYIETVNHADFHDTMLTADDSLDTGGSIAEAKKIEGDHVKPLSQISINIAPPAGKLPANHASEKFQGIKSQTHIPGTHRFWNGMSYYWNASLLNHQPLYFEDVNLERHGFSYGRWQPMVSGVKFFGTLPALPYLMGAQAPHEAHYTLGESRPGNHACYVCERPPFSWKGVAVQGVATTGLVFLIP